MLGIDVIVRTYLERIERCARHEHLGQPRSPQYGNCSTCLTWQVELLCLGRDPKTGERQVKSPVW